MHQSVFYDTNSSFIQVKVVKTHFDMKNFKTYVYVGLSNGELIEIEGDSGKQIRSFQWFKEQALEERNAFDHLLLYWSKQNNRMFFLGISNESVVQVMSMDDDLS